MHLPQRCYCIIENKRAVERNINAYSCNVLHVPRVRERESKRHHENHYVKDIVGNSTHLERLLAHIQLNATSLGTNGPRYIYIRLFPEGLA